MIITPIFPPTGPTGAAEPSRGGIVAALAWVVRRIRAIAIAIFDFLASFFRKKPDAQPPNVTELVRPPATEALRHPPPPQHHLSLRELQTPVRLRAQIVPFSSPHPAALQFDLSMQQFEGQERLTTELNQMRQCFQRLTTDAIDLLAPKFLGPLSGQFSAYCNQMRNLIVTARSTLTTLLPTVVELKMPEPKSGSFEDKLQRTSEMLLQKKEELLALSVTPLTSANLPSSLQNSILTASTELVPSPSTTEEDEDDYRSAIEGRSRATLSRAGEHQLSDDLLEIEEIQSEIAHLSSWLRSEIVLTTDRYRNAPQADLLELQNKYVTPVITWLLITEDSPFQNYTDSICPTRQPQLIHDIVDTCYNKLLELQAKAANEDKRKVLENHITLLEKQLTSFIDLTKQLESRVPELIANRGALLVGYFTHRLAQKMATAPWQDTFNALFARGIIATLRAQKQAPQDRSDDDGFAYINAIATSEVGTQFLRRLYGGSIHNSETYGPLAQIEAEHALCKEIADHLLKLLLPEDRSVDSNGTTIIEDAYDQLYAILKLEELLRPALNEIYTLHKSMQGNLDKIVELLGNELPAVRSFYDFFGTMLTQPLLAGQLKVIFDKDVKNPLRKEIKQLLNETVKKQLVSCVQKVLTQLTEPNQLDKLFGEVILPSVNETLLSTFVSQVLYRNLDELAPGLMAIKFPTTDVPAETARQNSIVSLGAKLRKENDAIGIAPEKLNEVVGSVIDSYVEKIQNSGSTPLTFQQVLQALKSSPKIKTEHEKIEHEHFFDELVPTVIYGIGGWKFSIDRVLVIVNSVQVGWTTDKIVADVTGKLLTEATKTLRKDHTFLVAEVTKALNRLYPNRESLRPLLLEETVPPAIPPNFASKRRVQLGVTAKLMHQIIIYPFSQQHSVYNPWYYANGAMALSIKQLVTNTPDAIDGLISKIYRTLFSRKVLNINLIAQLWNIVFERR